MLGSSQDHSQKAKLEREKLTEVSRAARASIRQIEAGDRQRDRERQLDRDSLARCGINDMATASEKMEEEVAIEYEENKKKSDWKSGWNMKSHGSGIELIGPPARVSGSPWARGEEEHAEAYVVTPVPQRPVQTEEKEKLAAQPCVAATSGPAPPASAPPPKAEPAAKAPQAKKKTQNKIGIYAIC